MHSIYREAKCTNNRASILETHTKTVIIIGGALLSVIGWFFWNLALSRIYEQEIGIFIVRDAIFDNFGRSLMWWTIILLELAALCVLELLVQAVRRVYWPTDEDLMQRVEKDAGAYRALQERARDADAGMGEGGDGEGFEMQDLVPTMDGRGGKKGKRRFGFGRKEKEDDEQTGED